MRRGLGLGKLVELLASTPTPTGECSLLVAPGKQEYSGLARSTGRTWNGFAAPALPETDGTAPTALVPPDPRDERPERPGAGGLGCGGEVVQKA